MKQLVTTVLSRDEIKKIDFTVAGIKVSPLGFNAVKNNVQSEKIEVEFSRRLARNTAQYVHSHNKMLLSFRSLDGDSDREGLIVHECVHAIADINGKKQLVSKSEASAFIAQCLYLYYRNEKDIQDGLIIEFDDKVLSAAWKTAEKVRENSTLSDSDLEPLLKVIAKDRAYRHNHSTMNDYDGV